ncbi:hypothetical protein WMY93_032339 [Mugilogobius chulae]|uniref:Sodium/potassium-transporting ATPase subunit beta-2 n=1 Tax=Mugilogobius chulae TaxID=88201 RepID=A0AAW0MSM7_9GOBI
MGRTATSWGLIFLFYLVFYLFLAGMFALTMYVMLLTLDDYRPTWQDRLTTPAYNDSVQAQTNDNCPPDQYFIQEDSGEVRNNPKRSCQFNRTALGLCSGLTDQTFGYSKRRQKCGPLAYFPPNGTFNLMYYPYYGNKAQVNYTQPLVAVKFLNVTLNTDLNVECRINSNTLGDIYANERDKFADRTQTQTQSRPSPDLLQTQPRPKTEPRPSQIQLTIKHKPTTPTIGTSSPVECLSSCASTLRPDSDSIQTHSRPSPDLLQTQPRPKTGPRSSQNQPTINHKPTPTIGTSSSDECLSSCASTLRPDSDSIQTHSRPDPQSRPASDLLKTQPRPKTEPRSFQNQLTIKHKPTTLTTSVFHSAHQRLHSDSPHTHSRPDLDLL